MIIVDEDTNILVDQAKRVTRGKQGKKLKGMAGGCHGVRRERKCRLHLAHLPRRPPIRQSIIDQLRPIRVFLALID